MAKYNVTGGLRYLNTMLLGIPARLVANWPMVVLLSSGQLSDFGLLALSPVAGGFHASRVLGSVHRSPLSSFTKLRQTERTKVTRRKNPENSLSTASRRKELSLLASAQDMGKSKRKNRSRKNQKGSWNKKRRKVEKFWVEDFPAIAVDGDCDVTVVVTEANLSDDHRCGPNHVSLPAEVESADRPNSKGQSGVEEASSVNAKDSGTTAEGHAAESGNIVHESGNCFVVETENKPLDASKMGQEYSPGHLLCAANLKTETEDGLVPGENREPVISIVRANGNSKKRRFPPEASKFRHLPNGDDGDGIVNPYPPSEVPDKYWAQRKRLFSRFEEGIKLDKEGWYSVTPEVIAKHIAQRMVGRSTRRDIVVLDAFCGVGGNSIALAARLEVSVVVCVDTDRSRLELAAHNCAVYKIPTEKIVFVEADACDVLEAYANGYLKQDATNAGNKAIAPSLLSGYKTGGFHVLPSKLDAIFLSPPWGGTEYLKIGPRHFGLGDICLQNKIDGEGLLRKCKHALREDERKNIAYFLPRNTNGLSLARSVFHCGFTGRVEMEMNMINHKFKTITVYTDSAE